MCALLLAAIIIAHSPERSTQAVRVFRAHHVCPSTQLASAHCPGYVVDHIVPIACLGADEESNMQYQTIEEGKAKDRWEIGAYCRSLGDID